MLLGPLVLSYPLSIIQVREMAGFTDSLRDPKRPNGIGIKVAVRLSHGANVPRCLLLRCELDTAAGRAKLFT
jgi:hypothetical protein